MEELEGDKNGLQFWFLKTFKVFENQNCFTLIFIFKNV